MRPEPPPIDLNFPDQAGGLDAERALWDRAVDRLGRILGGPGGIVLTPSCSAALELAAVVTPIGAGDEVIVPSFTHPSTANGYLGRGAAIRVADICPDTLNVDPESVARLVGPATRAIVVTHYAGVGADVEAIRDVAAGTGALVVEDAAHALFAARGGVPLGRIGDLGCISFHRTKNVSSISGGALLVNAPELIAAVDVASHKGTNVAEFEAGSASRYEWAGPGIDGRMSAPALSYLLEALAGADAIQARRHEIWGRYRVELHAWALARGVRLPTVPTECDHPAHIFHIVMPSAADRDAMVATCAARGVLAARHFVALHDSRFGRSILRPDDRCPVASDMAERLVRLPLHHGMSDSDVARVIDAVTAGPH